VTAGIATTINALRTSLAMTAMSAPLGDVVMSNDWS